ncbi:hypothetical protein [Granulicella arctica]|uniref:Glucose uptake protein GlcU n=1 Tax=Granulicella arctica TaxID=940613 RepID=A0A7Y9PF89_9BACT|nr:hypothetical protein [Granulicella arctica]NYF78600.1 glucose uptake protein GlcU [Granulicella arctica]
MLCRVCCGGVVAGQRFCPHCGTRISLEPPRFRGPVPVGRVERHRHTLGILWSTYGVLRLATAAVAIFALRTMTMRRLGGEVWPFGGDVRSFSPMWVTGLLPGLTVIVLILTLLSLLTGYALLARERWGRRLALVVGALTLILLPVGTALGAYTLWALGSAASGVEYEGGVSL